MKAWLGFVTDVGVKATSKSVEVMVIWNDGPFSISIPLRRWKQIEKGESLRIRGKGYRCGVEFFWDYWTFNYPKLSELLVEYCSSRSYSCVNCGTAFKGPISEAKVSFPQSDEILALVSRSAGGDVSDTAASGVKIDSSGSFIPEDSYGCLIEAAVDTGIWVREKDLPEVTSELLIEEGYVEDDKRLAELKNGAEPSYNEVDEYIARFVENAKQGDADSDFIPGYAIASIKYPAGGAEVFALFISFGYSFSGVRTELVSLFRSVDDAREYMRRNGTIG